VIASCQKSYLLLLHTSIATISTNRKKWWRRTKAAVLFRVASTHFLWCWQQQRGK